jgi:hypothetical protein
VVFVVFMAILNQQLTEKPAQKNPSGTDFKIQDI